jgi:hypothetical protein
LVFHSVVFLKKRKKKINALGQNKIKFNKVFKLTEQQKGVKIYCPTREEEKALYELKKWL